MDSGSWKTSSGRHYQHYVPAEENASICGISNLPIEIRLGDLRSTKTPCQTCLILRGRSADGCENISYNELSAFEDGKKVAMFDGRRYYPSNSDLGHYWQLGYNYGKFLSEKVTGLLLGEYHEWTPDYRDG